jgi:hypothetical protein
MLDYSGSFEYYSNMPLARSAAEQLHVLPHRTYGVAL